MESQQLGIETFLFKTFFSNYHLWLEKNSFAQDYILCIDLRSLIMTHKFALTLHNVQNVSSVKKFITQLKISTRKFRH